MNEVASGLTVGQVWFLLVIGAVVAAIFCYGVLKAVIRFHDTTEYTNGFYAGRLKGVKDSIDLERLASALDELKDITPK